MEIRRGNKKLGKRIIVINMTPALSCPSEKLGLCKHSKICYAKHAERMHPQSLPYRKRQAKQWDQESISKIMESILKFKNIQYLRFNESGDFKDQKDILKLSKIADKLKKYNIGVYGYTARRDLKFNNISDNLTINGSEFMIHNNFHLVNEYTNEKYKCMGNCNICNLCKKRRNITITVKKHR